MDRRKFLLGSATLPALALFPLISLPSGTITFRRGEMWKPYGRQILEWRAWSESAILNKNWAAVIVREGEIIEIEKCST